MILLTLLVSRTKLGKAMRATSYDREAAEMMGIDVNRVIVMTFLIGSILAGAGGVMVGLLFGRIFHFMGFLVGLKAFTAAVVGGIGSLPGAMLGGLLIGMAEVLLGRLHLLHLPEPDRLHRPGRLPAPSAARAAREAAAEQGLSDVEDRTGRVGRFRRRRGRRRTRALTGPPRQLYDRTHPGLRLLAFAVVAVGSPSSPTRTSSSGSP